MICHHPELLSGAFCKHFVFPKKTWQCHFNVWKVWDDDWCFHFIAQHPGAMGAPGVESLRIRWCMCLPYLSRSHHFSHLERESLATMAKKSSDFITQHPNLPNFQFSAMCSKDVSMHLGGWQLVETIQSLQGSAEALRNLLGPTPCSITNPRMKGGSADLLQVYQ